jgi:hypothetical protein
MSKRKNNSYAGGSTIEYIPDYGKRLAHRKRVTNRVLQERKDRLDTQMDFYEKREKYELIKAPQNKKKCCWCGWILRDNQQHMDVCVKCYMT